jgi:phenylalanyl-tRNA synthetase beta chain
MRYFESVHLFETGHVFGRVQEGVEDSRLGLVCASTKESDDVFYELKGAVELLLERLGIADAWFDDADPLEADEALVQATTQGRRAAIRTESGDALGALGIVSTRVTTEFKLRGSVAVCELDLRALISYAARTRQYEALPRFPSIVRDIALRVSAEVKIDSIIEQIQQAGGSLVVEVDVFDIFVPTGKEKLASEGVTPEYGKSVALHVTFRSPERTLTDVEVTQIEQRIKQSLEEVVGAEIR